MKVFALFGRPEFLRAFHKWATVFWLLMAFPSVFFWKSSISYLVCLSVYAVVVGHWSSYSASAVEVKQDQMMEDKS